jgi:hypothetical protein
MRSAAVMCRAWILLLQSQAGYCADYPMVTCAATRKSAIAGPLKTKSPLQAAGFGDERRPPLFFQ